MARRSISKGFSGATAAKRCTFDTMLDELGLRTEPLAKLSTVVRAADTARLDLAPEAAGLLAASLGLVAHVFR